MERVAGLNLVAERRKETAHVKTESQHMLFDFVADGPVGIDRRLVFLLY